MYGCLTLMLSAILIGAVGTQTPPDFVYTASRVEAVETENVFVCRLRDTFPLGDGGEAQAGRAFALWRFTETTFHDALSISSSSIQSPRTRGYPVADIVAATSGAEQ